MSNVDWTYRFDGSKPAKLRVFMYCHVMLDEDAILQALKSERIFINGKFYKVPKAKLHNLLDVEDIGLTELTLELIEEDTHGA